MSSSTRLFNYILNKSIIRTLPLITNTFLRNLSNKDVGFIKPTAHSDLLLQNFKCAASPRIVLDLVNDHHKIMNNKHLMQALRSIFAMQKFGHSDMSTSDLMSDPNFKILCQTLRTQARSIELNETIEALKVVSYLGIASNSTIIQVLLQLIRQNVNQLNLQQIIFLDYIIKQLKPTSLSDALLIALPIVFEVNLPLKMEKDNLLQLTDTLQFISRKHVADAIVELIINALMTHRYIDPKAAVSIVWSLCDLKPQETLSPLLHKALQVIIKHCDNIKYSDMETTLTKLAYRTNVHQPYFYNEEFFNLVADITIDKDMGFQQAIWIQQKFNKVGHTHKNLIDYLAFKCQIDDNIVTNVSQNNLYALISGLTNSEYKPKLNITKLKECIEDNLNLNFEKINFDSIKFATQLASLDIFIPKIIEKAFTAENVNKIKQNGNYEECKIFVTLVQVIQEMKPDLKNLLPSFENIERISTRYQSIILQDYPLQGALEKAFGGKQYILSNCTTRNGVDIHHAILMRKGGYPVAATNKDEKYPIILEDLIYPTDTKIVVILGLNASSFCLNSFELKGINSLIVRALEASGYSVVVIPVQKWIKFTDYEKIPYLMRAIKEKSDNLEELQAKG